MRTPFRPRQTDDGYLDDILGSSGTFAAAFPGYEPRPMQIAFARGVDSAITDNAVLLAEAPTGVGKSVGYLIPAIRHAVAKGKRVVVVTANIALQEQLVTKDLPALRELLPWPFTFALAKGRGNYLCLDRMADEELFQLRLGSYQEEEQWREIAAWAKITTTGDISELPFEPFANLRTKFTTSTDDCTGKACTHYEGCFANAAKKAYGLADVVVTNYHLFFADLAIRRNSDDQASVLPEWGVAILDEGHRAADIARDFFGFRITAGSCRWAARLLGPKNDKTPVIDPVLKERVGFFADEYFAKLRAHARSADYRARIQKAHVVPCDRLVDVLLTAAREYERVASGAVSEEVRTKLRMAEAKCEAIAHNLEGATELKNENLVYFVEQDNNSDRVALRSKLIKVNDVLREELFGKATRAVVVASATLKVSDSFDHVAIELGCEEARELAVESPFDHASQSILVVPTSTEMPDPASKNPREKEAFVRCVGDAFVQCVEMAGGRTLGLFTSNKVRDAAHQALVMSGWQGRILKQGDAPRTQLIKEFREDVTSVLLGCESFWEGVDVQGESLSCVVIDRLPFPTPDDPVLDAVDAMNRDAFGEWSLPRAVIAFRQGFGRLIRSRLDRGVVVMLDRRIVEKPYGRKFTKSLPRGLRIVRGLDEVGRFLAPAGEDAA